MGRLMTEEEIEAGRSPKGGFTKEQLERALSVKARSAWALQDTVQKVESRF